MTRFDHLRNKPAQDPASFLLQQLKLAGIVVDTATASSIYSALNVDQVVDLKLSAKRLRESLQGKKITIKHSHALDIVSRVAGFSSWNRASASIKKKTEAAVYGTQLIVEGQPEVPLIHEGLGDAVTTVLRQVISRINGNGAPAFCTFHRFMHGFSLDVGQGNGPWFSVKLITLSKRDLEAAGGSVALVSLDAQEARYAAYRLVGGMEQARPHSLVVFGAMSELEDPWHYVGWEWVDPERGQAMSFSGEQELFPMLEGLGAAEVDFSGELPRFVGPQGAMSLRQRVIGADGTQLRMAPPTEKEAIRLLERYLRFKRSLRTPVLNAISSLAAGVEDGWPVIVPRERFRVALEGAGLTVAELSQVAGVPYRDIRRLEEFSVTTPELVIQLAAALDTEPDELVQGGQHMGFGIDTPELLLKMAQNADCGDFVFGNSIRAEDERMASELGLRSMITVELAIDGMDAEGITSEDASVALLRDVASAGMMLIGATVVHFERSQASAEQFIPMRVLKVCIERVGEGTRALWHQS